MASSQPPFGCESAVRGPTSVRTTNGRWPMTCDEIRALLATRRQITFAQERAVQAHLASCTHCATMWQREERVMERFRALPLPPGELAADSKDAIRSALSASRPFRRQPIYRVVLISVALVVLLAVSLFPAIIRNYL